MAPRGLSAAEKKVKMLELFHETKEFFTLKELEKVCPKQKGITQQTVKETLDDLVGDGMVMFDKIGTSNYFWAFPSAAGATEQAALDKANKELETINQKIQELTSNISSAQKGREDTAERKKLLSTLQKAQETNSSLKNELAAYGAADPVKYERKKKAIEICQEAAVRWTDNSTIAFQYAMSHCGMEKEGLQMMTGIDDLDDWEDLKM